MSASTPRSGLFSGPIVDITNLAGTGDVVLVCEHAARFIPPEYDNLGLNSAALSSHIAWDPGALALAELVSEQLDAPLVAATLSRLLYDCNRAPDVPAAIPARSEVTDIPGNVGLSPTARLERIERIYLPFRAALAGLLDQRASRGQTTVLVTVHSFTPVFHGIRRTVQIGVLHDTDSRLADAFLLACQGDTQFTLRRNEPYSPADGVTHTLREHALPRGILNLMLEIRNDLIADHSGQRSLADWFTSRLRTALGNPALRPTDSSGFDRQ